MLSRLGGLRAGVVLASVLWGACAGPPARGAPGRYELDSVTAACRQRPAQCDPPGHPFAGKSQDVMYGEALGVEHVRGVMPRWGVF
jgi:hypothetical protein